MISLDEPVSAARSVRRPGDYAGFGRGITGAVRTEADRVDAGQRRIPLADERHAVHIDLTDSLRACGWAACRAQFGGRRACAAGADSLGLGIAVAVGRSAPVERLRADLSFIGGRAHAPAGAACPRA